MSSFLRDLRHITRALLRRPGFLVVSVLTLALGVGATTAIFSVVDGVLLKPLPYPQSQRIVRLFTVTPKGHRIQWSDPDFDDVRDGSRSFAAVAEVADYGVMSVVGHGEPVRAHVAVVSRGFFDVTRVAPIVGRTFVPDELHPGGRPAVVVSERFWRSVLGGAPIDESTTVSVDQHLASVVGVMPATLDYPQGADIWFPREMDPELPSRTAHNFQFLARLAPGVSIDEAQRELHVIGTRLARRWGNDTDMRDIAIVSLHEQLVGALRPALVVLLAAAGFLLLIACANVANLVIARLVTRQGELSLRLALGASRGNIVRQLVLEALVLAAAGGALGVLVAAASVGSILRLAPATLPQVDQVGMSWSVLLFALAVTVGAALLIGLIAAWRAVRADLRAALAQSQRTQAGTGGSARLRRALVVAQVAATMVLLVGAGLLGRSFVRLLDLDPGFRTRDALVVDLQVPSGGAADRQRTVAFYDQLLERLRAIPGVRQVGYTNVLPLSEEGDRTDGTYIVVDGPGEVRSMEDFSRLVKDPSRTGHADFRLADGGYFRTMGIPLVRGRVFDDRDAPGAPEVALISESFARARFPNEDPLGKMIEFGNLDGDLTPMTIVGVVGDVRDASLTTAPAPMLYADYRQRPGRARSAAIVLTGAVETPQVIGAARQAVRELRPDVPPVLQTMESVVARSIGDRRFTLLLVGLFGTAALLLAALGVYGVIAYLVAQRRAEIGVRIALGAQAGDVVRLVLGEGVRLATAGVVLGVVLALLVTRLLTGLLFGVSATDPVSFAGVAIGLLVVALAASLIPARRAAGVPPAEVLRG